MRLSEFWGVKYPTAEKVSFCPDRAKKGLFQHFLSFTEPWDRKSGRKIPRYEFLDMQDK